MTFGVRSDNQEMTKDRDMTSMFILSNEFWFGRIVFVKNNAFPMRNATIWKAVAAFLQLKRNISDNKLEACC